MEEDRSGESKSQGGENVFFHGEPCIIEKNLEQTILTKLRDFDNSIVIQKTDADNVAKDVSFTQGFYGHQYFHVEAAKRALFLNLGLKPEFGEWIFIEAQVDDEREFEWLKDYGIKYEFIRIPEESKWMFLKWPLWNLGIKRATKDKLAFSDADVVFCNGDWARGISKSLDEFDVVSLSRRCYYAEQTFQGNDNNLNSYKTLLDTVGKTKSVSSGHAGFTFGFTRKFLTDFKQFGASIAKHGDVAAWKRAIALSESKGFRIGCPDVVCCHVSHGLISDRDY